MEEQVERSLNHVMNTGQLKLERLLGTHPDRFPMYTRQGKWHLEGETWTNWCEGFLGGQLWLMFQHFGEDIWRERAEHYSHLIEHRKNDAEVHDLGFLFLPTWKKWYDLTGDPNVNKVVIEAGKTLSLRYQKNGNYLCSFLGRNSLFIDIMMNVGIIYYAAQQLNQAEMWQIAQNHVNTTRRFLVRGDGSTSHEGLFNIQTGEFLNQSTQQGWRNDSSWARGLAWALFGFGTVYSFTRDLKDLATAEACAQFYIDRTPAHGVPPNDWDEPSPDLSYESSAAAIAAGGFWQLAQLTNDATRAKTYKDYCVRILLTLAGNTFLAVDEAWEGILKHATYHQRKGLGVDESVMWGDYYFLDTVYKVLHYE